MSLTKIKLFFKFREYRKLTVNYFFGKLIHFAKLPFMYPVAVYKVYKLKKRYPDRWERHVAFRNIVNENERKEQNQNKVIAWMSLTGAISRLKIIILAYGYCLQRDDATEEQFQELRMKLDSEKSETLKHMQAWEEMGEVIPKELKQMILETRVDAFVKFEDYALHAEKMNELLKNFNVNYE